MYLHGCADMSLLFMADELMGCNCWLVASVSTRMSFKVVVILADGLFLFLAGLPLSLHG